MGPPPRLGAPVGSQDSVLLFLGGGKTWRSACSREFGIGARASRGRLTPGLQGVRRLREKAASTRGAAMYPLPVAVAQGELI